MESPEEMEAKVVRVVTGVMVRAERLHIAAHLLAMQVRALVATADKLGPVDKAVTPAKVATARTSS